MDPSCVGPYLIDRKIGAGGMGTVYLGRHKETGQEVAVKVLPPSLAREEGFVARFTREIEALKLLKNPHVVELFESGIDGEQRYYYAMEYVDGETLTKRLHREKRIDWKETIQITVQICAALKAAHDAGIVHRDLKPSNLMLARDGTVKLTDFGVAQVFAGTKLTATGGIIGTAEYMSPEQAQGHRATKKSDLYSLGAVMYVMLTGRPPFSGKTTLDLIQKHKYGQFDRPRLIVPQTPHWLEEIVCKLLEKEPDNRIVDAYVLSRRLQEVLKKVKLSAQEQTLADDRYEGSAPTVVAGHGKAAQGAGTIMRDLVRAEIEESQKPSPIGELFNNVWVLVTLLGLLILGGVLWFRFGGPTPQERFQQGVAIMEEPESSAWLRARDQFFEPLVQEDPDRWEQAAQPYLAQINLYARKLGLRGRKFRNRRITSTNDAERFYQLALYHKDVGNVDRAERMLLALKTLLAEQPEHEELYQLAQQALDELQADETGRYELLKSSIERAGKFADENKLQQARGIYKSILELYGSDSGAQEDLERLRKRLDKQDTHTP